MSESRTGGQERQHRAAPASRFDYDKIPHEMRVVNNWVCWKSEPDPNSHSGIKKLPINPKNGRYASTNNPETWGSFEDAVKAARRFSGIGFVFEGSGFFGIDIDDMPLDSPEVSSIVDAMQTYTERSQSGNGLHLIARGQLPGEDMRKGKIEMYAHNRYFIMTGYQIGDAGIRDCSEAVKPIYARYSQSPQPSAQMQLEAAQKPHRAAPETMPGQLSDDEILRIAGTEKNAAKFLALWHGDKAGYGNDDSRADAALCCKLAYYTKDPAQIDRLFRQSSLMRQKWDSPRGSSTYGADTIASALDTVTESYTPSRKRGRPPKNPQQGAAQNAAQTGTQTAEAAPRIGKTPLTIEALDSFLTVHGIRCRFNDVTHRIEYSGLPKEYDGERAQAQAPTVITSMLRAESVKGAALQTVSEYLDVIASKHHFNPVEELLDAVTWDGKSRIGALFDAMRLPAEDELSRRLIIKWMMQALSLCCMNDAHRPFGADGVLVLTGAQGYGKTTLARKLGISPELFKAGLAVDPRDKDSVLKATSCFIGELGEVETTMKRDIPALKSFITDEKDEVRRPYARSSETHIRRASFIATCNSSDFLLDTTGNRRFWTIPCEQPFDLAALARLDVMQLWAEIYEAINQDVQGFRLTVTEQERLNERNGAHTALIPAQAEILDILEAARQDPDQYKTDFVTVSEFAAWYPSLKRYDARQLGKALDVCGIQQKQIKRSGSRTPQRMRELPIPNRHFDSVYAEK